MKAVHVKQWGGPETALIEEIETPKPGPGEVLVKVKAAGINPFDLALLAGYMHEYASLPMLLGSDFAGDVVALGEGVEGIAVGTAVYGMKAMQGGAFAEYTTVAANLVAAKPGSLSYTEAAGVPHAGLTAWQALIETAGLQAGQRVLIQAAAGGVGHLAVQFAKLKGAYVIGTGSENSEAFVRGLGADEFVNYNTTPIETAVKDVDIVLDSVGFDSTERAIQTLKPGGVLVCIVTPPPPEAVAKHQIKAVYFGGHPSKENLTEIARLIDEKKVKVHLDKVMKFEQIHEAFQIIQGRHVHGKLVLTIG
jgi:NADPH:quinone reductase-like Zn-dependent oxidoreductase